MNNDIKTDQSNCTKLPEPGTTEYKLTLESLGQCTPCVHEYCTTRWIEEFGVTAQEQERFNSIYYLFDKCKSVQKNICEANHLDVCNQLGVRLYNKIKY